MKKGEPKINWEELNKRFYFLPERGYAELLLAYPFALYRGITVERIRSMLNDGYPKTEEHEILKWTYEIGIKLRNSFALEDFNGSEAILNEARKIASQYLDEQETNEAIYLCIIAWEMKMAPDKISADNLDFIREVSEKRGIDFGDVEKINFFIN